MELELYDRDGKRLTGFGKFGHPLASPWFGVAAMSPDGGRALVVVPQDDQSEAYLINLTEPFERSAGTVRQGRDIVARFDPTGRRLLLATEEGIEIWDLEHHTSVTGSLR